MNNILMTNNTQNPNLMPPIYKTPNKQTPLETIVQWNVNSYYKKLPDVHRIVSTFQPLDLCLQETNLKNENKGPSLKNYHGYFKNRNIQGRASGGVCIFVSSSIEHERIPLTITLEAIAITITTNNNIKTTIYNLYAPDSTDLTFLDFKNLISQLPHPLILLGDFNSRNIM